MTTCHTLAAPLPPSNILAKIDENLPPKTSWPAAIHCWLADWPLLGRRYDIRPSLTCGHLALVTLDVMISRRDGFAARGWRSTHPKYRFTCHIDYTDVRVMWRPFVSRQLPRKTLTQCWFKAGPASTTLGHQVNDLRLLMIYSCSNCLRHNDPANKLSTLNQCCIRVGPASQTRTQHWFNVSCFPGCNNRRFEITSRLTL